MKVYTINDPVTRDCEDFTSLAKAKKEARKKEYTPVFIDIYDEDEDELVGDVKVDNEGATIIP